MVSDFREVITHPTYSLPFLQTGRLVKVKYQKLDFGWGIVINFEKRIAPKVRLFRALKHHLIDIPHRRTNLDQNPKSFLHTSNMSSMFSSTAHQAVPSPRIKTDPT